MSTDAVGECAILTDAAGTSGGLGFAVVRTTGRGSTPAKDLLEAQTLINELLAFKVSINLRGHNSYGNDVGMWREGAHDNLVLAVVGDMREHWSLAGQLNELAELPRPSAGAYHWPAVANAALAHITKKLFSNASSQRLDDIARLEATLNSTFRPGPRSAVFERSVAHGKALAGFAPRYFSSFDEAAAEAATSRLYGGIHFRSAIELGLVQGKCIGERVSALKFRN